MDREKTNYSLAYGCPAKNLNCQSEFSRQDKTLLSWIECKWTRKATNSGKFSHWKRHQIFRKRHLKFQKPYQIVKIKKLWNIVSLQASNLATNSGHLLTVRRVSPSWTKSVFPPQIKLRILKLTIRRVQRTICIVLICVCWAENGYYSVVSVGQLSFDCRTYCGRSCRREGLSWETSNEEFC